MKADAECSIAFADISPPQAFEDDAKRISVVRVAIHVCVYAYFSTPTLRLHCTGNTYLCDQPPGQRLAEPW